jgi:hypothetical protein
MRYDFWDAALVAVVAAANRAKGSKAPDAWLPRATFVCEYVTDWQAIKGYWQLSMDDAERRTVAHVLADCAGRRRQVER